MNSHLSTKAATVSIPLGNLPAEIAGEWKNSDGDTSLRICFSIDEANTRLQIRAIDSSDGEELLVKNASIQDGWVCFDTVVPSSNYRVSQRRKFDGNGEATLQLILTEQWVREEGR